MSMTSLAPLPPRDLPARLRHLARAAVPGLLLALLALGGCKKGPGEECRENSACEDNLACLMDTWSPGTDTKHVCVAMKNASCAKACAEVGACVFSQRKDYAYCNVKSDEDCKKSAECKKKGFCRMVQQGGGDAVCHK